MGQGRRKAEGTCGPRAKKKKKGGCLMSCGQGLSHCPKEYSSMVRKGVSCHCRLASSPDYQSWTESPLHPQLLITRTLSVHLSVQIRDVQGHTIGTLETLSYRAQLCKLIPVSLTSPLSLTGMDSVEQDFRLGLRVPGLFQRLFLLQNRSLLLRILLLTLRRVKICSHFFLSINQSSINQSVHRPI